MNMFKRRYVNKSVTAPPQRQPLPRPKRQASPHPKLTRKEATQQSLFILMTKIDTEIERKIDTPNGISVTVTDFNEAVINEAVSQLHRMGWETQTVYGYDRAVELMIS